MSVVQGVGVGGEGEMFECSAGVGVGGEGEMKVIGVRVSFGFGTETNGWSNFLTKSTITHKIGFSGSLVNESAKFYVSHFTELRIMPSTLPL